MLKNHLSEIKGRLIVHYVEMCRNIHSDTSGTDWPEFYGDISGILGDITSIKTVSDLDQFCESFGLNDLESEFAFHNLAAEYLAKKD